MYFWGKEKEAMHTREGERQTPAGKGAGRPHYPRWAVDEGLAGWADEGGLAWWGVEGGLAEWADEGEMSLWGGVEGGSGGEEEEVSAEEAVTEGWGVGAGASVMASLLMCCVLLWSRGFFWKVKVSTPWVRWAVAKSISALVTERGREKDWIRVCTTRFLPFPSLWLAVTLTTPLSPSISITISEGDSPGTSSSKVISLVSSWEVMWREAAVCMRMSLARDGWIEVRGENREGKEPPLKGLKGLEDTPPPPPPKGEPRPKELRRERGLGPPWEEEGGLALELFFTREDRRRRV